MTEHLPSGENWIFEPKLDGIRCEAIKAGNQVQLLSGKGKDLTKHFPDIAKAVLKLQIRSAVFDGELLDLASSATGSAKTVYHIFDLLHCNSRSVLGLSLEERKRLLAKMLERPTEPLRLCTFFESSPENISDELRSQLLNGIVAKQRDSIYEPGRRSPCWLKYEPMNEQVFSVGGYIPASSGFESLLVGELQNDQDLIFLAKVLNGFSPAWRTRVAKLFPNLETRYCPFSNLPEKRKDGEGVTAAKMRLCRWLRPELRVRIAFRKRSNTGLLQHPTFRGIVEDIPL